jgi:hypothetical protein
MLANGIGLKRVPTVAARMQLCSVLLISTVQYHDRRRKPPDIYGKAALLFHGTTMDLTDASGGLSIGQCLKSYYKYDDGAYTIQICEMRIVQ